jgi:hypothetical protein
MDFISRIYICFPDVERAEWINRIIKQAWSYANRYKVVFRDVIISFIRETSSALKKREFCFLLKKMSADKARIKIIPSSSSYLFHFYIEKY